MNKRITYGKNEYYIFSHGEYYFMLNINNLEFYRLSKQEYMDLFNNTARGIDLLNSINSNEIQENLESGKGEKIITQQISPISSIVMEIANDCNLRCKYCYGEGGTYGQKASLMNISTAKKCVDFLICHGNKSQPLGVVFFGGEPLMNFKVVEEVIDYCNKKAKENEGLLFSFGMTTNALLLDSYKINYLKENKVMITVSIDGPKEYHNINRIFANGHGSYVSYCSQVPFFFSFTLEENFKCANNYITEKDIVAFLKKFGLADKIEFMHKDIINKMSIGQKQRLAVLRCILKKAYIYIFDEPTSALDKANTKIVADVINDLARKNKICIVITHDSYFLSLLKYQRILPIEGKEDYV